MSIENKITNLEEQLIELKEKITKLETTIVTNNTNYYNDNYNIKNEVNLDNNDFTRTIDFSEPKLMRQHAFMFARP